MKIALTIKGEPASKANSRQLVRFGNRPAIIKSQKARDYERDALLQIPTSKRAMLEGRLKITIHVYYRTNRPDLDESVILDVLQARYKKGVLLREGVYENDRAIREKHIFHHIDKHDPRAEILVETIDDSEPNMTGA